MTTKTTTTETTTTTEETTYAARITAAAIEEGLTATDAAERLATSEDAVTSAQDAYRNTLTLTVYLAEVIDNGERGKAADIARGLAARTGCSLTAAKTRVSRWANVGRILAVHPSADSVKVAAFVNAKGRTAVGITAAIAAKGDPVAAGERAEKAASKVKREARPNDGVSETAETEETEETRPIEEPTPANRADVIGRDLERAFDVLASVLAEIEAHPDMAERVVLVKRYESMTGLIRKNAVAALAKVAA